MTQGAELLFLLLGALLLFRLLRPLRDRLEARFVRVFPDRRRHDVVVDLHDHGDGQFGPEDPDAR